MGKILKGVVLGAAIGAGAAAVEAYRKDQHVDVLARNAAGWGAGAALAGGVLGLVAGRRGRSAVSAPAAVLADAAGTVRPYLERSAEQVERAVKLSRRRRRAAHQQLERAVKLSRRRRRAAGRAAHEQLERAVKLSRRQRKAAEQAAKTARRQFHAARLSAHHVADELSSRLAA